MIWNRRDLGKLIVSGGAIALLPSAGFARSKNGWKKLIAKRLTKRLKPGYDGNFKVHYLQIRERRQFEFIASIEMHWPPGFRRAFFRVKGKDDKEALARLEREARKKFGTVWPGCFG